MKKLYLELRCLGVLLPLLGGCATQGLQNVQSDAPTQPVASAPQVVPAVAPAVHVTKPVAALAAPTPVETQYGIQILQLGLTASGGLVDFRFKVLDAAKARVLLTNPANSPKLLAADMPPLMAPHNALRGARFAQGQVFYILFPNLRSTIKPGVEVTVAMGDARLGPVTAQ
jgi:hypothetical protein